APSLLAAPQRDRSHASRRAVRRRVDREEAVARRGAGADLGESRATVAERREDEREGEELRRAAKAGRLRAMTELVRESIDVWRPREGIFPPNLWFGLPTRRGGVSRGPYASLNLGLRVGDEPEAVARNQAILAGSLELPEQGPVRVRQVHGVAIVTPDQATAEADGFLLAAGDPWVAVSVADCAPVALVSRDERHGA